MIKKVSFLLLFALILVKIFFYQSILGISKSPDIDYHRRMAEAYSSKPDTLFFSTFSDLADLCVSGIARVAPVLTNPGLYASLTGKMYFLIQNFSNLEPYQLTTLIQVSFGLLTLFIAYLLAKEIFSDWIPSFFVVLILSSIQMFSYLMNHMSYDNLVNLFSVLVLYYLVKYIKYGNLRHLLFICLWSCLGVLTKNTIFPLLFPVGLILIVKIYTERKLVFEVVKKYIKSENKPFLLFVLFLTCFAAYLVFSFYGLNLIKTGSLSPSEQINIELNYCGLPNAAPRIVEPELGKDDLSLIAYIPNWYSLMLKTIVTATSHKSAFIPKTVLSIFSVILFISQLVLIVNYKNIFKNRPLIYLAFIAVFYSLFLLLFVNYPIYLKYRHTGITLQGRYIFPVIVPWVILFVSSFYYLPFFAKSKKYIIVLVAVSAFMIFVDYNYIVQSAYKWIFVQPSISQELGNVGSVHIGEETPRQIFYADNDTFGLALYVSTYLNKIDNNNLSFVIYDRTCQKELADVIPKKVSDNSFAYVLFNFQDLEKGEYCFNLKNIGSEKPITVWYSNKDLPGHIIDEEDNDIIYQTLTKEEATTLNKLPFKK